MKRVWTSLPDNMAEVLMTIAKEKNMTIIQYIRGLVAHHLRDEVADDIPERELHFAQVAEAETQYSRESATTRPLTDVILVYEDLGHSVPAIVHAISYRHGRQTYITDRPSILEIALKALLPKGFVQKLKKYNYSNGAKKLSALVPAVYDLLSKVYVEEPDVIHDEVKEEFSSMEREATAEEAFNRGLK